MFPPRLKSVKQRTHAPRLLEHVQSALFHRCKYFWRSARHDRLESSPAQVRVLDSLTLIRRKTPARALPHTGFSPLGDPCCSPRADSRVNQREPPRVYARKIRSFVAFFLFSSGCAMRRNARERVRLRGEINWAAIDGRKLSMLAQVERGTFLMESLQYCMLCCLDRGIYNRNYRYVPTDIFYCGHHRSMLWYEFLLVFLEQRALILFKIYRSRARYLINILFTYLYCECP